MQLVTRAQWGARPRGKGAATPFDPKGVAVHWVGGGWTWPWPHTACDDKVRGIQADHMDSNGWSDIAYNFLACPHGYVYEGRGLNRRSSANGDATVNTYWYAVCCLWGTKSGSVTEALLTAARDAIDHCRDNGGAGNELRGHRDLNETSCPGDQLYAWVRAGAPRPSNPPPSTGDGTMAWTDAQIAEAVKAMKTAADELLEVTQLLRTHAVRMDNLVNDQLPKLREDIRAINADVDRAADVTAGQDDAPKA